MPPTKAEQRARARLRAGLFISATLLAVSIIATVWANQLWALKLAEEPTAGGRAFAIIPPLLMAGAIEMLIHIPVERNNADRARFAATLFVGGCVAIISFSHMHAVAVHFGEPAWNAVLYPLGIDGVVLAASLTLHRCSTRLAGGTARTQPRPSNPVKKQALPQVTAPAPPAPQAQHRRPYHGFVTDDGSDKAAQARRFKAEDPKVPNSVIADTLGVSTRTVTRYLNEKATADE